MTPDEKYLERRDRQAAILADVDKTRHSALAADGAANIRWAVATGVTVNGGGIALLASRDLITWGDQAAMSLLVISIVAMLLSGWAFARSSISEAGTVHLSLTERNCEGSDLSAEREELWTAAFRQDSVAGWSGVTGLVAFLAGGRLGIWL